VVSAHAELHNAERDLQYPARKPRSHLTGKWSPEEIRAAKQQVKDRLNHFANQQRKARPARLDPEPDGGCARESPK